MKVILAVFLFLPFITNAQQPGNFTTPQLLVASATYQPVSLFNNKRKLYQHNTGVIIGLQRGKYTSLELGGEAHWRKISLLKPHIIGATANLSYHPGRNVLGYHAGVWMKRGHINLTYGADLNYFTDFNDRQAFAIGPSVGFRFFGFDLVNGFNIVAPTHKSKTIDAPLPVNTLYISLRYFLPVKNEFTWDRQTMKKKRARKKARLKRIEARKNQNSINNMEKKKWNINLPFSKKQ
jgi:hypothetical protein